MLVNAVSFSEYLNNVKLEYFKISKFKVRKIGYS